MENTDKKKSEYGHFSHIALFTQISATVIQKRYPTEKRNTVFISNDAVKFAFFVKPLGIHIEDWLKFNHHISNICKPTTHWFINNETQVSVLFFWILQFF